MATARSTVALARRRATLAQRSPRPTTPAERSARPLSGQTDLVWKLKTSIRPEGIESGLPLQINERAGTLFIRSLEICERRLGLRRAGRFGEAISELQKAATLAGANSFSRAASTAETVDPPFRRDRGRRARRALFTIGDLFVIPHAWIVPPATRGVNHPSDDRNANDEHRYEPSCVTPA